MYMLCGATAGLAGVLLTARTTSGNPINGVGFELQAITAVFLGGAATTGGAVRFHGAQLDRRAGEFFHAGRQRCGENGRRRQRFGR